MRCHADELIYRPRASSTWSGDPVLVRRPTRAHVLGTFFAEERRGGRLLFASFLDAPIPQDENGPSTGAETTEGPLDPHGHPFKQNKVCGHVLAAGEQRCCEKRTVDACHECCIKKSFDGIEGEPTSDTCRRTCIRMCYKGKDANKPGKHFPRCPDDPDSSVSLYPTNDQDSKLKDFVQIEQPMLS
ncbi:unnamed protein product [Durusdinium trenchii]|uniref:Uncharacterized protein n=1 Tax=Durusdinium trenchii TaxID=1381693 RepID=A0ABP0RIP7_9DINO